jgi:GNAT superfamily N-acetyltransferase
VSLHIAPLEPGTGRAHVAGRWIQEEWGDLPIVGWLRGEWPTPDSPVSFVLGAALPEPVGLVGCAAVLEDDLPGSDLNPWLGCVYVCPAHRRLGYGGALTQDAAQRAKALGLLELYLFCEEELEGMYVSAGWQRIGTEMYQQARITIMRKVLA